jgi:phosphatidylserine synthase
MYEYIPDLPNLVTLTGVVSSFYGVLSVPFNIILSIKLAIFSILLDNLDGYLARKQENRSDRFKYFGQHLDCYADYITKGFIPSTLLYYIYLENGNYLFLLTSFANVICITLRYSYEFSNSDTPRGMTPDVGILIYGLIYLLFNKTFLCEWLVLLNAIMICYTSTMKTKIKINQKLLCYVLMAELLLL